MTFSKNCGKIFQMGIFSKMLGQTHTDKPIGVDSTEERRKRIYVLAAIIVSIPVLIGYGVVSWIDKGSPIDTFFNFALASCFLVIAILIKNKVRGISLYRFGTALLAFLLSYNAGFGPYGESEALWLLVFPLVAFYLFGNREGLIWITLVIFPSALFIFFPYFFNTYIYPIEFRIALSIAIFFSIVLSYLLESLRAHFNFQLEKQNIELIHALGEVKKLSGLIPICASCKNIRDDKGFWSQIEEYIRDHSEAEFSHGICPECSKKLYPEIDFDND